MTGLRVRSGECWIHVAFDAAAAIDLERAEHLLGTRTVVPGASATRESISGSKRTPPGIQFKPKPVRVVRPARPHPIAATAWSTAPEVELTLYDFGAISVAFRVVIDDATLEDLRRLAAGLSDAPELLQAARAHVDGALAELGGAARRVQVADPVEDHLVFLCRQWEVGAGSGAAEAPSIAEFGAALAQVLRAADEPLSESEVGDALACAMSYGLGDLAIIDWNAAILFEPDPRSAADLLAVLEFANVELVELRFLDDRLDGILDRAYRAVWSADDAGARRRRRWPVLRRTAIEREHRRLAALQMDSALLFEGVNNALKLLGDQYLARVYRLAARRFHLSEWDAAILRKLETLQQLYEKHAAEQSTRRMEILEWIIIILIALSIVIVFIPGTK